VNSLRLAFRQIFFENRAFWRSPAAAFFTFIMPIFFLILFNALFKGDKIDVEGGRADISVFYVPGIAALGVISACFTNISMMTAIYRDLGVLKRVRGTPLPAWAYLFGRIGQAMLVAMLLVVIITGFGAIFFGVDIPGSTMPAYIVTIAVGAASFCALGLALSSFIPNADSAPAVTNATILPLLFVSDVFIHMDNPPTWLTTVGNIFPVKHFANALQHCYNPYVSGAGFQWGDLGVMALWGAAGAVIALRYFTWEPRR